MSLSSLFRNPFRLQRVLRRILLLVVGMVVLYLVLRYDFPRLQKNNDALVPAIRAGERILVDRWHYSLNEISRGEIVGYRAEWGGQEGIVFFSRVLGIPGDRVESKKGMLCINGLSTEYEGAAPLASPIPEGSYLLLNDCPTSLVPDSRFFGLIEEKAVIGKVLCYLPF